MTSLLRTLALAASAIVFVFLGCGGGKVGGNAGVLKRVPMVTKLTPIEFTFPAGWYANPKVNPYDLQCMSPSEEANTGVFAFRMVDLEENATPQSIFQEQIEDLRSKRRNFVELEKVQKQEYADKSVTTVTYRGEKDSSENYYRFALLEFKGDTSRFAIALQVAVPSAWSTNKPVLEQIVQSARLLPETP